MLEHAGDEHNWFSVPRGHLIIKIFETGALLNHDAWSRVESEAPKDLEGQVIRSCISKQ